MSTHVMIIGAGARRNRIMKNRNWTSDFFRIGIETGNVQKSTESEFRLAPDRKKFKLIYRMMNSIFVLIQNDRINFENIRRPKMIIDQS